MPSRTAFGHSLNSLGQFARDLPRRLTTQPSIAYKHRLTLSPWDKFRRFRRFPFKLTLNLLVTVLCTTRVVLATLQHNDYVNAQHAAFEALFRPGSSSAAAQLYTIDAVIESVNASVQGYFNYVDKSVEHMSILAADGHPYPIIMTLRRYVSRHPFQYNESESFSTYSTVHVLSASDPLGPLNVASQRELFDSLASMTLEFRMDSIQMGGLINDVVYRWRCRCKYDLVAGGGQALLSLSIWKSVEMDRRGPFFLLDLFSMLGAIVSVVLTLKALHQAFAVFSFARSRLRGRQAGRCSAECESVRWENLSIGDRVAFFNLWYLVTILADVSLILACAYAIGVDDNNYVESTDTIDFGDVTRAAGCFLQWLNLMKYFEWRPDFYVLVLAMRCSLARVARFIITSAPLYMGFALAGVVLFSNVSDKFGSLDNAAVTLFALVNGDSIFEVFADLAIEDDSAYHVLSRIYLYSFCTLFITTVINVFIFIIEDGYRLASTIEKPRTGPFLTDTARLKQILDAAHCVDFGGEGECMHPRGREGLATDVDSLMDDAVERMADGYAPVPLDDTSSPDDDGEMLINLSTNEAAGATVATVVEARDNRRPTRDVLEDAVRKIQDSFANDLTKLQEEFVDKVKKAQSDAIDRLKEAIKDMGD